MRNNIQGTSNVEYIKTDFGTTAYYGFSPYYVELPTTIALVNEKEKVETKKEYWPFLEPA